MDAMTLVPSASDFATQEDFIESRVLMAWSQSGYAELRRIRCEFRDGTLLLQGTVGSYFLKQMAQATASRVQGVERIDNRLHVQDASSLVIA